MPALLTSLTLSPSLPNLLLQISMLLLNEGGINQKTRHAPSSQSSEGNDLLFKHDMYIIINYTAFGLLLCRSFLLCNKG